MGTAAGRRRILVPGIMTAVMLVVLVGLGTWQVQRLQWKNAVLAQIARAESGPPAPLPGDPSPYAKIEVTGRFATRVNAEYGLIVRDIPTGTQMGTRLIVPLERDNGPPVLVDRGWIPLKRSHAVDQPEGTVTIVGYIHPADEAGWFSAPDDVAARTFYTLNPFTIGAALGYPGVLPFTVVALGEASPGHWPIPAQHLPRPPNNHLSYIITWYGLAVSLIVIFTIWARKGATP